MITDEAHDPALRALPLMTPDHSRAAQVRARCHARLARRRPDCAGAAIRSTAFPLGQAVIGGLCLLYFSAVVHDALRLRGIL